MDNVISVDVTTLGRLFGRGAEGSVYLIENPVTKVKECLKIYLSEYRTPEREKKVRTQSKLNVNEYNDHIAWPNAVVEDTEHNFIGFKMKYVESGFTLADLFERDMSCYNYETLVNVAINTCLIFKQLHEWHIIQADCNPKNFLITNNGEVNLIDTDSLQFSTKGNLFKPMVASGKYLDPDLLVSLSRECDNKVSRLPYGSFGMNTDRFSMAVLVFQILMLGYHPFTAGKKSATTSSVEIIPPENAICNHKSAFFSTDESERRLLPISIDILPEKLRHLFKMSFFGKPTERPDEEKYIFVLKEFLLQVQNTGVDIKRCFGYQNAQNSNAVNKCPVKSNHQDKPRISIPNNPKNRSNGGVKIKRFDQSRALSIVSSIIGIIMHLVLFAAGITGNSFATDPDKKRSMGEILYPTGAYLVLILGILLTIITAIIIYQLNLPKPAVVILIIIACVVEYLIILALIPIALSVIGWLIPIAVIVLIGMIGACFS